MIYIYLSFVSSLHFTHTWQRLSHFLKFILPLHLTFGSVTIPILTNSRPSQTIHCHNFLISHPSQFLISPCTAPHLIQFQSSVETDADRLDHLRQMARPWSEAETKYQVIMKLPNDFFLYKGQENIYYAARSNPAAASHMVRVSIRNWQPSHDLTRYSANITPAYPPSSAYAP